MEFLRTKLGLWILLFFVRLNCLTDAHVPYGQLHDHSHLLENLKTYELIKPYRLEGRQKRSASTRFQYGHVEATTLVFDGEKNHFILDIVLNKGLFSSKYTETQILRNGTKVVNKKLEHCFYHGTARNHPNSTVSLSTCDGIEGIIVTDQQHFYIKPLQSKEGGMLDEHLVFSSDDVNEEPVTCGQSHKISPLKEMDHLGKMANTLKRVRRDVNSETKYVELFLINDNSQYRKYRDGTELRAKRLANHLDSIYKPKRIRIALVMVETWKDRDLIHVDKNATIAYRNFIKYKKEKLDKDGGKHWDNVQLITSIDFDTSTVGYAYIGSICGTGSAAIIQDHSSQASTTAATMAHELGHNLGMVHDAPNCECPHEIPCIMNAVVSPSAKRFSKCSSDALRKTLEQGYGICLFDEPSKLYGPAICGNGFVEEGEQCDCGGEEGCPKTGPKCCNATTCMLLPEAACGEGECCEKCQFKSKGHLCREKKRDDECDLPEYCTGENEMCPEDGYVHDATPCQNNQGYCYKGMCRELNMQCKYLFGNDVKEGGKCFDRNKEASDINFAGCFNETAGKHLCREKDVKCGKLFCEAKEEKRPKVGQDRNYVSLNYGSGRICLVPVLSSGDGQYLEYVQDGTKCGEDLMCKGGVCLPVDIVVPERHYQRCPNNCSGNGVCNHNGNCHCNPGYACPDCKTRGHEAGGSSDSGQGCKPKPEKSGGGVNVAAAVLIPLFVILLLVLIAFLYWKRRDLQDRISRYKLVRRTVARSSSNANTRRTTRPPGDAKPTISGPTVEFPGSNIQKEPLVARRTAPLIPSAPPNTEIEPQRHYPAPVQPPSSGAWRPPFVPPPPYEPETTHESVPLYPPSANPEAQAYKPRPLPPPPGLNNQYENLPTAPAPKPLPGKPKLPPGRQPLSHSVPDLPSERQPTTPPVKKRNNPPRPKPRLPPDGHRSVPDFPDDVPVPKPREVAPRRGHQSVPLFDLPDGSDGNDVQMVKPSTVKANQAKPVPVKRPRATEDNKPTDFRAGLKPVPKPWEKV